MNTNPLLRQFIPEARDLLDQADRSLLALERDPGGAAMNELFRAVHTLKGTSGLFDIQPLTRVVHAAEDLLDAVQAGRLALAAGTADILLDALGQVGVWIDGLDEAGELPSAAEMAADSWVARLRAPLSAFAAAQTHGDQPAHTVGIPSWAATLSPADQRACVRDGDERWVAITYIPDTNCFFRGEDPLALIRQVPELRLLRIERGSVWPDLGTFDPFACDLQLHAIAAADAGELAHLFRYVPDQVRIETFPAGWPAVPAPADPDTLELILAGQRRLLRADGPPELWPGRLDAAARAVLGALYAMGRPDLAPALTAAVGAARAEEAPGALLAFIDGLAPDRAAASGQATVTAAGQATAVTPGQAAGAPAILRVEQGKIDTLMNLIGELVVAKNALAWLARQAESGTLGPRELAREIKDRQALVNRIAEDMQGAVMAVRMLPVEHVFQRFPRLVRDISRRLGKQAELVIEGGETEADKNVIEALADPLIHIVRNSLDHGLETPADRVSAGKPAHGTIRLVAAQDNDNVVIRVSDDGRGIDPEAVKCKAVANGLIDPVQAESLSEQEAVNLVFTPGFSTAITVSDLSGRGVGMDVVRNAVEKAGGRVQLTSLTGQGTTIELVLPLTMVVTRIMTVACGGRLFGVPMSLVVETVRMPRSACHQFRDREAFVLRDSVVPLVRLARLLDLPPEPTANNGDEAILVVRVNGDRLGLVVDAFREGMEVIVKPMDGILAGLRGFAGTTLLGDGRVLLILDLRELVG